MKGKLRLVPPLERDPGGGDEPPFDENELREAEATAAALARGSDPMAGALTAAFRPRALDEVDHDALLDGILDDARAPRRVAERAAEIAGIEEQLVAAWRPSALDPVANEQLIAAAVFRARRSRRGRAVAAVTGVLALAASVALLARSGGEPPAGSRVAARVDPAPPSSVALIPARSVAELFDPTEAFPRSGGESARIDRIAAARATDLRANRYARWGVR